MELLVLLLRLLLAAAAFLGVCSLVNRRACLPAAYVPLLTCCLVGCALMLMGILNVLRMAAPLFLLAGAYGLITEFRRGARPRWWRSPATLALLVLAAYFFVYFYGRVITEDDDFNHWAIIVRVMLRYHRLPRFTDTVILFPSYPPGTAGLLYLGCRLLGTDDGGTMLFFQTGVMLCAMLPLLARVRTKGVLRAVSYAIILLFFALGLTMNPGTAIQSLYVDALLALLCLGGVVIAYDLRADMAARLFVLLPIAGFLAITKGSGLYFSAVLAAQAGWYVWRAGNRRRAVRCFAGLLGGPAGLLILWNRHADLVFEGGLMTRHSTSPRYMLHKALSKGGASLLATLGGFLHTLGTFSEMLPSIATLSLVSALALLGALTRSRSPFRPRSLIGASVAVYVTYLLGLLGMYLFNMPEDSIEAFSRYLGTALLLITGIATLYLLELINALPALPVRTRVAGLCAAGALLAAFCWVLKPPFLTLARYPSEREATVRELASYMPEHDKETRYLVYIWDGHREQNYGHRMTHYVAYPAQSDIVSTDDDGLLLLDRWTEEYDYFIAFWTDDAYRAYAVAHGLDPDVKLWTRDAFLSAYTG